MSATQAQRLALEYPSMKDCGICDREWEVQVPQRYKDLRATLPARELEVDDILAAMCERLGAAYEKYDECHLQTGKKTREA